MVGTLLSDDSHPFGALFLMRGWPANKLSKGYYIRTGLGSHTYTFPLAAINGKMITVTLTMGVLNQTPIYGVMGFEMGKLIVGFQDFPLEARIHLQMSPTYQDIILLLETEVLPHIETLIVNKIG